MNRFNLWQQVRMGLSRLTALVVVFMIFGLSIDGFLSMSNFESILIKSGPVAAAAIGATLVIIAGGIDLSVGSVVAMSVVTVAITFKTTGSALLALLCGLLAGFVCGLVNGLLVCRGKFVPFVATLGTLQIFRGVTMGMADETNISIPDSWLIDLTYSVSGTDQSWMILPGGTWMVLISAVGATVFLRYTTWGRHTYAVGSNEQAARLCGVRVGGNQILIYALAGLFAGLGGLLQYSYITTGNPSTAKGLELAVIAAVVIGGGSLRGGVGSVFGTLVGAITIETLFAGCVQMGWEKWKQTIMTGIIILIAVGIDQWRVGRAARKA